MWVFMVFLKFNSLYIESKQIKKIKYITSTFKKSKILDRIQISSVHVLNPLKKAIRIFF